MLCHPPARPPDRRPRRADHRQGGGDGGRARRQRRLLQDRPAAHLRRRDRLCRTARAVGKEDLPRCQAPRHRQYRRRRGREHCGPGDDVPHHPRLPEGDARGRRGTRAGTAAAPRRDRSHLHGRSRPGGGGLCRLACGAGRKSRGGRPRRRHGRDRRRAGRGRVRPPDRRSRHGHRHARHPAGRGRCGRPEAGRDA